MTEKLFIEDAYLKECRAQVVAVDDRAIVLDRTVFYALGGGQPGDTGTISWDGGSAEVVETRYGEAGAIRHVAAEGAGLPEPGTTVTAAIDWDRRYIHMRMHTAMHLVGSLIPFGVTGGNISAAKSRLDFDMQESVDKEQVNAALAALVEANHPVSSRWISDAELEAQPELVRTLSVRPPRGAGMVRLLEIEGVDLQPCGGTHLASTGEVGRARISKVENKGRHNRRVNIVLDD
ncbi:MAG: alanyl-tRNA editing protein [Xanthomonadales bacterium]|nr:alanyl-tRNA editing protein [Xanthomonadales bacterium]NIX13027.1 alanyl-tRNA editing protein [Xanthomonadales bacterium]